MTIVVKRNPSDDLLVLIKAAANNLTGFADLWISIKKKGGDEGFTEQELEDMIRPLLKPQLNKDQIYYLFHKEQKIEQVKTNNRRKFPTDNQKKDTPPEENPLQIENEYLKETIKQKDEQIETEKIRGDHLEEALHKTEQFRPATQLQQEQPITNPDEHYFKWLADKANGIQSFYYDRYGIDLFKNRILSQLKNSGVTTFKRLYFEV